MINRFDRMLAYFAPRLGAKRAAARFQIDAYTGATDSRLRSYRRSSVGANAATRGKIAPLKFTARAFEENSDLAKRVLDLLVQNCVGQGIIAEPTVRKPDGTLHVEFNRLLSKRLRQWRRRPETSHRHSDGAAQQLGFRSFVRDGEVFAQHVRGTVANYRHAGPFPYSYELIESDRIPLDFDSTVADGRIMQGAALNDWGEPKAWFVWPFVLDDRAQLGPIAVSDLIRKDADRMLHAALVKRIGQLRGVSIFATIMARLEDINDVDEAERVAVRLAASIGMAVYSDRPKPPPTVPGDEPTQSIAFEPAMILHGGIEDRFEILESKRPTEALIPWRKTQAQSLAGGAGVTYSALTNDYLGSYSSQRQELVEGYASYGMLSQLFVEHWVDPIHREAVGMAVRVDRELFDMLSQIDRDTLNDAQFSRPAMPWVDPEKEANALQAKWDLGIQTKADMIRERGGIPDEVLPAVALEKTEAAKAAAAAAEMLPKPEVTPAPAGGEPKPKPKPRAAQ